MCSREALKRGYIEDFLELTKSVGYEVVGDYINARTKIELVCLNGHEVAITPDKFKQGRRCKECAIKVKNEKKIAEASIKFVEYLSNINYKLLSPYRNSQEKVRLQCDNGHLIEMQPNNLKQGKRCGECSKVNIGLKKRLKSFEEFKDLVITEGYVLVTEYTYNKNKVILNCPYGHSYEVTPDGFKSGNRCKQCSIDTRKTESKKRFYQLINSEGYSLVSEYISQRMKVTLQCPNGHMFKIRPDGFEKGVRCGVCAHTKLQDEFKLEVESVGYELITDYISSEDKVTIKCDKDHLYEVRPYNFKSGNRCPNCSSSLLESRLATFTKTRSKELFETVVEEFKECVNPKTGYYLPYDIYIEDCNTIIEVHGGQHYNFTSHFHKDYEEFAYRKELDDYKKNYAISNGYKFIEIDIRRHNEETVNEILTSLTSPPLPPITL